MKSEEKQEATKEAAKETPYYIIQSLNKTLNILQCFIDEHSPMGVSEIARKMNLHKSVVHRLLLTLQTHGYLEQDKKTEKYMVGPKAFELGSVYTNSTDLVDAGKKILVELVEKTGFTAHLAILEKDTVLYLVNVEPDHLKYLFGAVGQRREVYHSALGKCLTAWLPEEQILKVMEKCTFEKYTENTIGSLEQFLEELKRVRQVGFAVDKEEKALGAHCLGAPVRNKQGDVIAAISVSGYGISDDKLMEMSMIVKSSAAQLSRRNGNFDN